jgi:chromosome segregation ATPase
MCLASLSAFAEESPDQRLNAALLEQGLMLQAQAGKLQPQGMQIERDRARLIAEEKELSDEAMQVTRSYSEYNVVADELNAKTKKQREDCAGGVTTYQSQADECNARAEELRKQSDVLAAQGVELDRRQDAVNKRIVAHNAAGREWNDRAREHQAQWMPSVHQMQDWLMKFKQFYESQSFPQFAASAGQPAACASEQIGVIGNPDVIASLGRAVQCLQALKGG